MKRLIPVIILLSIFGCSKKDKDNLIWERTFGPGEALFIGASPDSGFIVAGQSNGKPYLVRYSRTREKLIELTKDASGLFSSAWCDSTSYITGGSSAGKVLIMKYNQHGSIVWEKSISAGFNVLYTKLLNSGNGRFVALGTASSDSASAVASGLYFVVFDTAGTILTEKKISESSSLASVKAVSDNNGNIYLALTKRPTGGKPMAYAAKYNSSLIQVWEKAIFNNAAYASTSLAVNIDGNGNVYLAGKTEIPSGTSHVNNSFITCLTGTGAFSGNWAEKQYPEIENEASAVLTDASNTLLLLNRNCMIINLLDASDGSDAGALRSYNDCVPKSTDALANDFTLDYEGNILLAGKLGGNFFIGLRGAKID